MIFAKIDAQLDSNPKVRKAGRDGREVFLFLLRKNASSDFNGTIPAAHVEPWYLADQLMMDEVTASNGLSRAVTAGLLREVDGGYAIAGWDDEWAKRPLTNGERQERHRQKHNTNKPVDIQVTNSNDDSVTSNASNALDQRREEKKRVEEIRVPPSANAKPKRAGSQLSADWKPTPNHTELAREREVDLAIEVRRFRSHAETHERIAKNWNAAFSSWLLKAFPDRKGPQRSPLDIQLERVAMLEREEAEREQT